MKVKKIWGIVLLVLAVGCVVVGFAGKRFNDSLEAQTAENDARITELENSLSGPETAESPEEAEVTDEIAGEEEKEAILDSASKAGNLAAQYQNTYNSVNAREDREAYMANVEAMGSLLTEDAQNARVRWYYSEPEGTWSFYTRQDFEGDTLGVLWLCTSSTGELLCYSTGIYHADSGLFSDISYNMTLGASANVPFEDNGIEDDGELTVDDLPIDEINDVDVSDIPEQSDEELQEIRNAQEKLRQMYSD